MVQEHALLSDLIAAPLITGFAAGKNDQVETGKKGIPQLRPTNILPDGDITFDGAKEIPSSRISAADCLVDGEILFNNTNSTTWVGKSALFNLANRKKVVCSNHITRIRIKLNADAPFIVEVINMMQRAGYFGKLATNFNNQAGINSTALTEVVIPLSTPALRIKLITILNTARHERQQKVKEADALLAGLDGFVLDALGLRLPMPDARTIYAVRAMDTQKSKKLYPDYFHPERIKTIKAIETQYKGSNAPRLIDIADFIRDQRVVSLDDDYLGLANVQPNTGERIESTEEDGKGNSFKYIKGDVLFARLRPYLNKVYRAESDGVCSTEFHVIRIHKDRNNKDRVIPDYLATVLRSSLILSQTRHMMTGNTHPRLTNEDVVNLIIPKPDWQIQKLIADEVARRRAKARQLRSDAELLWKDAKRRFEEELLGPAPSPEGSENSRKKGGKSR